MPEAGAGKMPRARSNGLTPAGARCFPASKRIFAMPSSRPATPSGGSSLILHRADPNDLTFARIATLFLEASLELGQGHRILAFRENFLDRDIVAEMPAKRARFRLRAG